MSNELLEELELAKGNTDGNLPFNLNSQYIDKKEFREFLNFNSGRQDYEIQRNEIILELGYLCGCRAAEVVFKQNFRARQLKKIFNAQKVETSLNDGFELGIIGKGASGGKHRIIWVPDDLSRKLKAYFQRSKTLGDGNIICTKNGKHLNKQFASSVFTNTRHNLLIQSQDLGDWGSPSRSFHSLRHSYATNFILDNGSHDAMRSLLKSRMGHEDFKTTEIYLTFSAILRGETYMQKTETNHEQ
jgi:integrase